NGGLGPISDMSPSRIFINWGNSSKLVFLRSFPALVTLSSPFFSYTPPASAPIFIVLNLKILNTFPFNPNLFCLNITGPFESNLIQRAIINSNGDNSIIAKNDSTKSIVRFNKYLYITLILLVIQVLQ